MAAALDVETKLYPPILDVARILLNLGLPLMSVAHHLLNVRLSCGHSCTIERQHSFVLQLYDTWYRVE